MIDGQIHNILSVAGVITEIKELLEERHGPLKRVSVAAAGRALKTSEGSMAIDISEKSLISTEDVNRLELAAVQQAQQKLLSSDAVSRDDYYYCVGYSVLHYKLEGEVIGSLIEQAGKSASVDVIATFLPRVVVESLLSALKHAGLEMEALTLEPIAAINVLIPPSMRRLNVALVDIGAGTSDIAITDNNTVVAYGMVPVAGDEITEAFSNHYLLDFPLAESAKKRISTDNVVIMTDILGFEQEVASSEITAIIKPAVDLLAKSISCEVKRLNNAKSPKAVMLVGGGSLTPGLAKEISICLDLPENRVGIRGLDALTGITLEPSIISSPELVTPIGIAIAARRAPIHYMSVSVNNKLLRLFELKEMTVGDALLAANIKASQLYGRPGLGMTVTVNDNDILIPGEHGTPSAILLNGFPASTKNTITNGDMIELVPGINGLDASAIVSDLLENLETINATINGVPVKLEPSISINGIQKSIHTLIKDRDKISASHTKTIATVIKSTNPSDFFGNNTFLLRVNQKEVTLKRRNSELYVNGIPARSQQVINEGDKIIIQKPPLATVNEVILEMGTKAYDTISIIFNHQEVTIQKKRLAITLNGLTVEGSEIIKQGDCLDFVTLTESPIIFSDIFAFTDYSMPENSSSHYQLLRNRKPIGFNDPIYGGDILEILFT